MDDIDIDPQKGHLEVEWHIKGAFSMKSFYCRLLANDAELLHIIIWITRAPAKVCSSCGWQLGIHSTRWVSQEEDKVCMLVDGTCVKRWERP